MTLFNEQADAAPLPESDKPAYKWVEEVEPWLVETVPATTRKTIVSVDAFMPFLLMYICARYHTIAAIPVARDARRKTSAIYNMLCRRGTLGIK